MTPADRFRDWVALWWLRVPEPRVLSLLWTVAYGVAVGTGLASLIFPLIMDALGFDRVAVAALGWLLVLGGVVGMIGGSVDWWALERIGIALLVGALVIFGAVALSMHLGGDQGMLAVVGLATLSAILFLIRFALTWPFSYRPRG